MNHDDIIFQTERSKYAKPVYTIWIILMVAFNIWGLIDNPDNSYGDNFMGWIVSLAMIGIVIYFFKNNFYKLTDRKLEIVSGFREWEIKIEDIYLIKRNQNPAALNGLSVKQARAGQGLRGIIIYYEKDYSIYISPKSQDRFLEMIKEINKDIDIKPGPPLSN
jgi:hypothetical protein